jgi:hypothetical protein
VLGLDRVGDERDTWKHAVTLQQTCTYTAIYMIATTHGAASESLGQQRYVQKQGRRHECPKEAETNRPQRRGRSEAPSLSVTRKVRNIDIFDSRLIHK